VARSGERPLGANPSARESVASATDEAGEVWGAGRLRGGTQKGQERGRSSAQ